MNLVSALCSRISILNKFFIQKYSNNLTPYLQQRALYPPFLYKKVSKNLGMIIVIPAYKEPFLLLSLMSLKRCILPICDIEVLVIINDGEMDAASTKLANQNIYEQAIKWSKENSTLRMQFRILYQGDLPPKFAGVGLARKIGMDEACYRFEKIKKKRGIIVCFDADSLCQPNYLVAIEDHFRRYTKIAACSIHFEHPLDGADFEPAVYQSIAAYELHLRYFINAQKWAGAPYAYQTIGSSMAVRSDHYQKQGGMNRRKAGEDFYFLHKFIRIGKLNTLTNTTVIPSPRISDRVPFGTGKAVGEIIQEKTPYQTYNPQTFEDIKVFFKNVSTLYDPDSDWRNLPLSACLATFLDLHDFTQKLTEIRGNTSSLKAFKQRFFLWFDAFKLMKFAHFARDGYYENKEVAEAAGVLLEKIGQPCGKQDTRSLLQHYRAMDKK